MPNYGIYSDEDSKGEGISGAERPTRIPLSAFWGHKVKGKTVVIKTNYLKTRGVHKYKLLDPRKEFWKVKKHIDYVGREENVFYNEEGQEISKDKVWEEIKEKNPFIIHRMVLSPWKKLTNEQFKAFVRYEMVVLREMLDKRKRFDCFYAKHDGDYTSSANAIIYSNNWLAIKKDNLEHMRKAGNEFIEALEKGKVLEPAKEMKLGDEKETDFGGELEI